MEIPLPGLEQEYSGKFVVRLPRYLHRQLAEEAAREGASLNQFVVTLLSAAASTYRATAKEPVDLVSLGMWVQCIGRPTSFAIPPWDIGVPAPLKSYPVIAGKIPDSSEGKVMV